MGTEQPPWLLALALGPLLAGWRRPRWWVSLLALATVLASGAPRLHLALLQRGWERDSRTGLSARVQTLEHRTEKAVSLVRLSAAAVAALPETRAALDGNHEALVRLFSELDSLAGASEHSLALAVHTPSLETIAWTGHSGEPVALSEPSREQAVFVLADSVSATLVASAPIQGPDGVAGLATAELRLAVRRHAPNELLRDSDLLAGDTPGVDIRYVNVGEELPPSVTLESPPKTSSRSVVLRSPDGGQLGVALVRAPTFEQRSRGLLALYRRAASALASLTLCLWAVVASRRRLAAALALSATRMVFLVLGPPAPGSGSPLLSPEIYASSFLGPFLRSPLDLLLTAVWLASLVGLCVEPALRRARRDYSAARAVVAETLAIPLLVGIFAWVSDTGLNCVLDLEAIPLLPRSAPLLAIHAALLVILASGTVLLACLLTIAGPLPVTKGHRAGRLLGWSCLAWAAWQIWPRGLQELPPFPAAAVFVLAVLLGGSARLWSRWLGRQSAGMRTTIVLGAVAITALLLHPSLVHFGSQRTRFRVERDHAPLVLRQPELRRFVLAETRRQIDALDLVERAPSGFRRPRVEQTAFAVWAATELATFGFTSAVEIQDTSGAVVSRFALKLPTLSGPGPTLPADASWVVDEEQLSLASAERPVLHARRRLLRGEQTRGAVHVYVADDYWNLPFIADRDPYSALYRPAVRGGSRARRLDLLALSPERGLVFASATRPPALDAELVERTLQEPAGLWTTLQVDGQPHHAFLFSGEREVYALYYPRLGAGRAAADLVEAVLGMFLLGVTLVFFLMSLRSLAGRSTLSLGSFHGTMSRRFSLRLFVAFMAVALVPVAVLQALARGFVADRLATQTRNEALERASMAKKAVEDFAFLQRGESPGSQPVTDAALVWVSSVIGNDLDVFDRGRLRASSKRELYASDLLPQRVPGAVFREISLEGRPSTFRSERIGDFVYQVASVRLNLETGEPVILSLPLALREMEAAAVLADLDRTSRLASVLFMVVAAVLALSMARRISGPIADLTRATRRVAEGDLEARVAPKSDDELRELVESFNQMAGDLARQRAHIHRSNRLAAWAEMARQVAHEVKNPLTPIQLSAEHLRRVFRDPGADFPAALETCTQTILKQVRSLRCLVTEFSAFARPPSEPLELHDLAGILRDVVRPYEVALPPGVELSLETGHAVPAVRADRRLLERAAVNLLENALQAVHDGGRVVIRLRLRGSGRVEVEVEDSGPGFDAESAARAFEPFFSTKTSGSGLGLALVKKIAEDVGGGVSIESPAGGGTRVVLWLPSGEQRGS
jgi:signal transduction histidine kinase